MSRSHRGGPLAWAICALVSLAGCATLNPDADGALALNAVLGDVLHAVHSPESEQRAALARAQEAFGADPSTVNRLRLATLFAGLAEPLRSDARASELLAPLATEHSETPLGRFAALLAAQIAERQRLAALAVRQERAAHAAGRREETLKRQLDALKEIERSIGERERRGPRNNKTR
jgi:hypothetical protein